MGRAKGFRVLRKAAEEFTQFTPPPVTKRVKAHPNIMELHSRMSQPPQPLKFKLQPLPEPDSTWQAPLGQTAHLPFHVPRTFTGNLPVSTEFRNNRQRKLTVVRKVVGDLDEFKAELAKVVSNAPIFDKTGRVEVRGLHTEAVKLWLRRLGF